MSIALGLPAIAPAQTRTPSRRPASPRVPQRPQPQPQPQPQRITLPSEEFGRNIGDDYFLVNYTRMIAYWQKLDRHSPRTSLQRIGTTAEERPMLIAVISDSEDHRHLSHCHNIARRLA